MKFKSVKRNGKLFLARLSFPIRNGSLKIHLIVDDDKDTPHMHPWNFKSFLFLGAYKEIVDGKLYRHLPFSVVKRKCSEHHQVILYRFLGFKLPCLTIGRYTKKIQQWCERKTLCDSCQKIGYCSDKAYWKNLDQNVV